MELRILKPLDRTTAVVEIWNKELLIARIFARPDGVRRFHFSTESARWGSHWGILSRLAARVTELLDAADEEMRRARASAR